MIYCYFKEIQMLYYKVFDSCVEDSKLEALKNEKKVKLMQNDSSGYVRQKTFAGVETCVVSNEAKRTE